MLVIFVIGVGAFSAGVMFGKLFRNNLIPKEEKLLDTATPIETLINDFEEYARAIDGGLSTEASLALNILKERANQKQLKAPEKKPITFPDDRKNEWGDLRCFEKEMEAGAGGDDERILIICRWMNKYRFTSSWQTWCIQQIKTIEGRNKLREIFDAQE